MLLLTKILTSSLMIVLITEVAKRHSIVGGLIAVLPVNILLALTWLYIERRDMVLVSNFSKSALLGIIPTALFLLLITVLFQKNHSFVPSICISLFFLALFALVQYRFLANL